MRTLVVLLILAVSAPALGETKIIEKPDRFIVEITGTPDKHHNATVQEDTARDEQQEQSQELQDKIAAIGEEIQELRKPQPGDTYELIRLRREQISAKLREIQKYQDELQNVDHGIAGGHARPALQPAN